VQIRSTFSDNELWLTGHTRGKLYYNMPVILQSGIIEISIPDSIFPSGILHLTLFDNRSRPQCERLVFVNHNDPLNIAISTDKSTYGTRKEIIVNLEVKDLQNNPVQGNFSLSVANRTLNNNSKSFQSGMTSYLLLASDLKGNIQEPDYYFAKNTRETRQALDNLLLTQGWRRFKWDHVVGPERPEIKYSLVKGLEIEGKITRELFGIPIKNLPVTLTVQSGFNDVYSTTTNDKGKFVFSLPDYVDTVNVEITAVRRTGRKNLVILVDESELPETEEWYSKYTMAMEITGTNIFKPVEERQEDTSQFRMEGLYREPDDVIYLNDQLRTYNNVYDIIKGRIPGVDVQGDRVIIRGIGSLYGGTDPLYLIDNIPVDKSAVSSLNPNDVERIEILKGPSAAIYGSRGANGVISIYTRRGFFMKKGVLNFQMLGYYHPREFYSPRYGTNFDNLLPDDRTTLFWAPEVITNSMGQAELIFYSSDTKGTFEVVIEGISDEGIAGEGHTSFEVQ